MSEKTSFQECTKIERREVRKQRYIEKTYYDALLRIQHLFVEPEDLYGWFKDNKGNQHFGHHITREFKDAKQARQDFYYTYGFPEANIKPPMSEEEWDEMKEKERNERDPNDFYKV